MKGIITSQFRTGKEFTNAGYVMDGDNFATQTAISQSDSNFPLTSTYLNSFPHKAGGDVVRPFSPLHRLAGNGENRARFQRAPKAHLDTSQSFDIRNKKKDSARRRNKKTADRYERMAKTQDELLRLFAEVYQSNINGLKLLADNVLKRLRRCHKEFAVVRCPNFSCPISHKNIQPMFACKHRACPHCAEIRRDSAFSKKLPILRAYHQSNPQLKPVLITLTQRNDSRPLYELLSEFKKSVSRLKRTKEFKRRVLAAVIAYECPLNQSTGIWHLHCHILAFRTPEYWDLQSLSNLWANANRGKSSPEFGAHIRSVSDLSEGLNEVLKYIYKPGDVKNWSCQHAAEILELRRIKMSETFGGLRGMKVEKEERKLCDESQNGEPCRCGGNDIYEECCELCPCGSGNEFRYCCKKYYEGDHCPWCNAVLVLTFVTRDRLLFQLKE